MRRKWMQSVLACLGLSLAASACGSSSSSANGDGADQSGEKVVEIFSWWIAPGEAEALQALVDVNKQQHPADRIFNAAADTHEDQRAKLAARLAAHDPPDLFQQNAHDLAAFVAQNPGTIQPLDDFFAGQGLNDAVMPDVLHDVTVNGKIYAMPVNIHRENSLFYNKQILQDHGVTAPRTLDEFLTACQTLKAAGVTPIATANQGWILRVLFNELAMGSMGSQKFHDFMSGGARDDVAFKAAIDLFDDVLTNYTNDSRSGADFGWTNAADLVFDGQAAMFLHGDWAKGYYEQLGWTPGVDFGVLGAPGGSDVFWYGVDTFSLPVGAPYLQGATDFLGAIGSLDGQVAFNKLKGSTPVRDDVSRAALDSEGRATLDDFQNATFRMPVVNQDAWDQGMATFATSHDKDALFQVYVDHPPAP